MLIGVTNDNHDYSQNIKFSNFTTWACVEKENIATQAPVTRPVLSLTLKFFSSPEPKVQESFSDDLIRVQQIWFSRAITKKNLGPAPKF